MLKNIARVPIREESHSYAWYCLLLVNKKTTTDLISQERSYEKGRSK